LPFTGGSAYDWVTRTVVAGSEPSDASPLIFVPHLYGGLSPDWQEQSKGSLLGLTLSHTAEDIRLALMRGLAFETRRNIEAAEPHAGRPASLRMVGGATHSDIWPQIIADATDLRVEVPALTEAACYGAAKLAAGHGSAEPPDWPPEKLGAVQVFEPARDSALDLQYEAYMGAYAWLTRHYRGESAPTPTG
jgi:xylulokinase